METIEKQMDVSEWKIGVSFESYFCEEESEKDDSVYWIPYPIPYLPRIGERVWMNDEFYEEMEKKVGDEPCKRLCKTRESCWVGFIEDNNIVEEILYRFSRKQIIIILGDKPYWKEETE